MSMNIDEIRSLRFRSSRYGQFCLAWESIGMAHATAAAMATGTRDEAASLVAVSIGMLHMRVRMLELASEWAAYGVLA